MWQGITWMGGKSMKLGFDLDEVVVALCDALTKYMNDKFDLGWTVEDFKIFNLLHNKYSDDEEYNDKIAKDVIEVANDIEFQMTVKSYEGAPEFIRKLKKEGNSIHFITSRKYGEEDFTAKWLRKYKIPFDTLHHAGLGAEKGRFGRILNLDFYIDDCEEHLKSMYRYKKRWKKGLALMDRPWNRDSIDGSRFIRIKNWKELTRHLGIHKR